MSIDFFGSNHNEMKTVGVHSYATRVYLNDDRDADYEDPRSMNLASANGRAFLAFLGFDPGVGPDGEVTIAEMRRAIFRAVNTFDRTVKGHTREEVAEYGSPREIDGGIIEMRPLRVLSFGIDEEYFSRQLARLSILVEALAARGATHIAWG